MEKGLKESTVWRLDKNCMGRYATVRVKDVDSLQRPSRKALCNQYV